MGFDLNDIEQLAAFDDDCANACRFCPQATGTPPYIGCSEVSIAEVFVYWFKNHILWDSGYHEQLRLKSKETFNRYSMFRDGRVFDSESGVVYKLGDTFRVRRKVVKA